ncbi:MAG: hypothetical protein ACYC4P_15085 [Thermoanaerobaculia bacterium]
MNGRRLRASLLLLVGWLFPAATSAALVLHEIDHEHGSAAPAAMVALFHGHLHSDSEPAHAHELSASPASLKALSAVSPLAAAPKAGIVALPVPVAPFASSKAWRDDADPGGPSRQALLRVFRI